MKLRLNITIFCIAVLLINKIVFSQSSFQRTYGNTSSEIATCIQHTNDGNYILAGRSNGFTNGLDDAYLTKVDLQGNVIWSKAYGGTKNETCYYVYTCSDGGFIMTGSTDGFGSGGSDLFLIRTDSDGNHQWSTAIGSSSSEYGWSVVETNDGGFLAAGNTNGFLNGTWNGYMVKTNSAGILQSSKIYAGTGGENFSGMSKTKDGGFIVTGLSSTNGFGSSDIWLMKLDSNTDTVWTALYGKATEDAGNSVRQTADGGYIVAGDSHIYPNSGAHHEILLKTDSLGNIQWARAYGSIPGSEVAYDVAEAGSNGYYMLGNTNKYGNGSKDFLLLHSDTLGNLKWSKTFGSSGEDDAWSLQLDTDGGIVMVGGTSSFNIYGQYDIYMAKTDSTELSSCNSTSPTPQDTIATLQMRRGINIISGGVGVPMATITTNANTLTQDPCLFISTEENVEAEYKVDIFPNPVSNYAIITINYPVSQDLELLIYDLMGSCIHKQHISTQRTTIELHTAAGIYFYKVLSSSGTINTGKIIVQ